MRRAIAMLSDEGYVKVVQGKGTEVRDISTTQQLNTVTSITETLKRKGYNITVEGVNIQLVQPPEIVREKLKLEPEVTVYLIQRILYADDKPIAIMNNYLVKVQIPGFEQYAGKFVGLYNFLENTYGVVVTEADDTFSAVNADCIRKIRSLLLLLNRDSPHIRFWQIIRNSICLSVLCIHTLIKDYSLPEM